MPSNLANHENGMAQNTIPADSHAPKPGSASLIHSIQPPNMQSNKDQRSPPHSMRKPAALQNRKGLPQKYNASQIIIDEEFLLSQTPQKSKILNSVQGQDMVLKQIQSDRVQRWFNAEYFYSQMDRAYYASEDFSRTLEMLDIGAAQMSSK